MRILTIEDDEHTGQDIVRHLLREGYASDWIDNLEAAEDALSSYDYGIIILDNDHSMNHQFEFLEIIRQSNTQTPLILISSDDTVQNKVRALDSGADDYLCKPFDTHELMARIRAIKRRSNLLSSVRLNCKNVELDPAAKIVKKSGKPIMLGAKEFAILRTLMEKPGHIISKTQIEDGMYGWDDEIASNTVEVHIHGLRQKLGKDFIKTIRHSGYVVEDV